MEFYGVILAAFVTMLIGYAWYSPKLFGTQWAKLSGVVAEKKGDSKAKQRQFFLGFLVALVMSFCMKNVLIVMRVGGLSDAYWAAVTIWAGFIAPVHLSNVVWENKSIRLFTINATYHLLVLIVMAIILIKI